MQKCPIIITITTIVILKVEKGFYKNYKSDHFKK